MCPIVKFVNYSKGILEILISKKKINLYNYNWALQLIYMWLILIGGKDSKEAITAEKETLSSIKHEEILTYKVPKQKTAER